MIERNLRAPRSMGECKFNPSDAMVHKFPPSNSRNPKLDRWIMLVGLVAMVLGLLMLSGCSAEVNANGAFRSFVQHCKANSTNYSVQVNTEAGKSSFTATCTHEP